MDRNPSAGATIEMSGGMQLDLRRLEDYLRTHVAHYRGPLSARQLTGGRSNSSYLLVTPECRYVLRKQPPGRLHGSARALERGYRVLCAVSTRTALPVPRTYALCLDESVLGTCFYIMEYVDGRLFQDPSFSHARPQLRPRYFDAMNAAIATLHRVDPAAVGLADSGNAGDYLTRQIADWTTQYHEDPAAGRVAAMDRLIKWLPRHVPVHDAPPAIVHGDFRVGNLVFHRTEPRLSGILDWESSEIGDPLADFAYHLMMYRLPTLSIPGLAGALRIPAQESYIEAYCARTGRSDIPDLDFYLALCLFRLAVRYHGIRGRVLRGTAVSARARGYAQQVELVADLAWEQAERAMRVMHTGPYSCH
jgi:aminoglycoside phosphotransferase (APT) family kinase protein